MTKPQDRNEVFKTALSAATRSIAGRDHESVEFSADGGRVAGETIYLSTPPKDLTAKSAARARGEADALALRVAHHDARKHAAIQPQREDARRLFEAAERARVESLGALAMDGVADNLDAALQARCERSGYSGKQTPSESNKPEALEFLLREMLTGRSLPAGARGVADAWRAELLPAAAEDQLAQVRRAIADQQRFGEAVRDYLRELKLDDEHTGEDRAPEDADDQAEEEGEAKSDQDGDQEGEDQGEAEADAGSEAEAGEGEPGEETETTIAADADEDMDAQDYEEEDDPQTTRSSPRRTTRSPTPTTSATLKS
jgi:cobaltochelatase CobT